MGGFGHLFERPDEIFARVDRRSICTGRRRITRETPFGVKNRAKLKPHFENSVKLPNDFTRIRCRLDRPR